MKVAYLARSSSGALAALVGRRTTVPVRGATLAFSGGKLPSHFRMRVTDIDIDVDPPVIHLAVSDDDILLLLTAGWEVKTE